MACNIYNDNFWLNIFDLQLMCVFVYILLHDLQLRYAFFKSILLHNENLRKRQRKMFLCTMCMLYKKYVHVYS